MSKKLTPEALKALFPYDKGHPIFTKKIYSITVAIGRTSLPYWEWVASRLGNVVDLRSGNSENND